MGQALTGHGTHPQGDLARRVGARFAELRLKRPFSTDPEFVVVTPTPFHLERVVLRLEEVWTGRELAEMDDAALDRGIRMVWELVRWSRDPAGGEPGPA